MTSRGGPESIREARPRIRDPQRRAVRRPADAGAGHRRRATTAARNRSARSKRAVGSRWAGLSVGCST